MAVQGTLNSVLSKVIGLLETSFLGQLLGGAAAAVLLYVLRLGSGSLAAVGRAPWYTLLAGPIGVAIVYGVAFGIGKVGVAPATTAIIIGQVSTAVIIDSFGLFGAPQVPFHWTKVLGVALLAAAAWIMLRKW
jgi:transporter family-2 protein